jgi:hypothetical protein
MPRNTVSVISRRGEVVLNYSKVFICDFGKDDLLKPNPNVDHIGCDVNCSPGESFDICTLAGAAELKWLYVADSGKGKPDAKLALQIFEVQ